MVARMGSGRVIAVQRLGRRPWSMWRRRSLPGGTVDGVKMLGRRVAVAVILDLDLYVPLPPISIFVARWAGSDGGSTLHCRILPLLASPSGSLVAFAAAACRFPVGRVGAARST
jgi:hypothetical protein